MAVFTKPDAPIRRMLHCTNGRVMLRRTMKQTVLEPVMSYQFNEQLNAYTHQFAAVAARVNRLALENAETLFGVQLRTLEKNVEATASYFGRSEEHTSELQSRE